MKFENLTKVEDPLKGFDLVLGVFEFFSRVDWSDGEKVLSVPYEAWNDPNPLVIQSLIVASLMIFSWSFGMVWDWSTVDRLWSILPIIMSQLFVAHHWCVGVHDCGDFMNWSDTAHLIHPRLLLASVLISLWGLRLSYNFLMKGGYSLSNGEDYRWTHVRQWFSNQFGQGSVISWIALQLFHLLFVCVYQLLLIWSFTFPLISVYQSNDDVSLTIEDGLIALIFLVCLVIETLADHEMFEFQITKAAMLSRMTMDDLFPPFDRGFCTTGLYQYSRHPNYFAEQAMWLCISLFSTMTIGWNWTIIGVTLLILLFQGSATLAENISLSKYPTYKDYQSEVPSRMIPLPF